MYMNSTKAILILSILTFVIGFSHLLLDYGDRIQNPFRQNTQASTMTLPAPTIVPMISPAVTVIATPSAGVRPVTGVKFAPLPTVAPSPTIIK